MKQYTYIQTESGARYKVLTRDNSSECSEKVKLTGYKKKRAHDAKHKPTERIAKVIDAKMKRETEYKLNKARNAARYAKRR